LRLKVKVLFFASLREQLGTGALEVDAPPGVSYEGALGEKKALRMAVNQEMVPASAPLKAGDEVAFFPPVTGG
jgi:molybdopterin synthase sulfur carrier subunit